MKIETKAWLAALFIMSLYLLLGFGVGRATAQEVKASVDFTARGQGYWIVYHNGNQVSQHTTEREAYQSAANAELNDPDGETTVEHNAVIDVEAFYDYPVEPEPEPLAGVSIPGASTAWVPVPGEVRKMTSTNDTYPERVFETDTRVNNLWLNVFEVDGLTVPNSYLDFANFKVWSDETWLYINIGDPTYLVNRPAFYYRQEHRESPGTELSETEVTGLIDRLITEGKIG